jgi:hypothetical protein
MGRNQLPLVLSVGGKKIAVIPCYWDSLIITWLWDGVPLLNIAISRRDNEETKAPFHRYASSF